MKLDFNRQPKKHNVGVRVTEEEMEKIKKIAKKHNASIGETCGVLLRTILSYLEEKK